MRRMMMGVALALFVLPAAAGAGELWSYEQENGSLAFTDDERRVPKKYRDRAEKSEAKPLADYERLTVSEVTYPTPAMLAARDAAWLDREVGHEVPLGRGAVALDGVAAGTGGGLVLVEVGPGLTVPVTARSGEPIQVRHNVYRWRDGRYTPFTIIRQGDTVLAEIARP